MLCYFMYGMGVGDIGTRTSGVGVAMGEDNMNTLFDMFSAVVNFSIDCLFRFAHFLDNRLYR